MAGGVKLTGARGKGPTAHGSKNQKHRANEGERANTSMPRNRPEGKAGAADTMAGAESIRAHAKRALDTMKLKSNGLGR